MKDGVCPKCNGKEVYQSESADLNQSGMISDGAVLYRITKAGGGWLSQSNLPVPSYYLCGKCGYTETYLNDQAGLRGVRASGNWKRV